MPTVTALDKVGGIRPILGLFKGARTRAADGYGRIMDRSAMILLHFRPGSQTESRTWTRRAALDRPDLDWVMLTRIMGVPGARAETGEALVEALKHALPERGPQLIEMIM
jgi:thiamine pyrophosphate-dependent acetolactate synthase large subunit-like protein